MNMLSTLLLLVVAVHQSLAQNATLPTVYQGTNVYVSPMAQSGKITIGWDNNFLNDANRVEISLYGLQEVNSNGGPVTNPGHSFNGFTNLTFAVSPIQQETINSIPTQMFTLSSILPHLNTQITITVYIIQGYGSLLLAGETTNLAKDNIKVSISLQSSGQFSTWPWTGQNGFLDVNFAVRSQTPPVLQSPPVNSTLTFGDTYNLGFGNITFSHRVEVDGQYKVLSTGYPLPQVQQGVQIFTVRLPQFNQAVNYDPVIAATPIFANGSNRLVGNFGIFISLVALLLAKMFSA